MSHSLILLLIPNSDGLFYLENLRGRFMSNELMDRFG